MTRLAGGCDNEVWLPLFRNNSIALRKIHASWCRLSGWLSPNRPRRSCCNSGIEERVLPVGSVAPGFALQDARSGKPVRSDDLLALGPLVINFFRGRWCPYCVTELETWRELYPELRERGALFVAISPQTPRQNDFMMQQHALPFPLLADPGAEVAEKFGHGLHHSRGASPLLIRAS